MASPLSMSISTSRVSYLGIEFARIKHVKQDQFVSPEPQRLYGLDDGVRILEEI